MDEMSLIRHLSIMKFINRGLFSFYNFYFWLILSLCSFVVWTIVTSDSYWWILLIGGVSAIQNIIELSVLTKRVNVEGVHDDLVDDYFFLRCRTFVTKVILICVPIRFIVDLMV